MRLQEQMGKWDKQMEKQFQGGIKREKGLFVNWSCFE